MSLETILEPLERIEIVVPARDNPRRVFAEVAALYQKRKVELTEEGHIIVMPPAGIDGGYRSGDAFMQLAIWAKRDKTGKAFDSSAGFYITPERYCMKNLHSLSRHRGRSPVSFWI